MLAVSVEYNVLSNANAPRTLEFSIQAANLMLIIAEACTTENCRCILAGPRCFDGQVQVSWRCALSLVEQSKHCYSYVLSQPEPRR